MTGVEKDGKGNHGKYGTLAATWDAIRKPLSDNEIAVYQRMLPGPDGSIMATMLIHSSGEFFDDCELKLVSEAKGGISTMQAMGSAVTYARRYSLQTVTGVAPEDDDDGAAAGNAKGGGTDSKLKGNGTQARQNAPSNEGSKIEPKPVMANDEQMSQLYDLVAAREITDDTMIELITTLGGDPKKALHASHVVLMIEMLKPQVMNDGRVRLEIEKIKNPPKTRTIASVKEPADYVLPLGEGIKGKKLGSLDYGTLLQLRDWCEKNLKVTPPLKNLGEIMEVSLNVKAELKVRDGGPVGGES